MQHQGKHEQGLWGRHNPEDTCSTTYLTPRRELPKEKAEVGERPAGNRKAAIQNSLWRLSFHACTPTPGTGLDQKLNGGDWRLQTLQMSHELPASPSPGMNAQACHCSSFPQRHPTCPVDLLQCLAEHSRNSAKCREEG